MTNSENKETINLIPRTNVKTSNFRFRLFLLQLIALVVLILCMSWFDLGRWRDLSRSYIEKKGVTLAKTIEGHALTLIENNDIEGLNKLAKSLTSGLIPENDVISVQILNADRHKVAESSPQIVAGEQGYFHLPATLVVANPIKSRETGLQRGELRIVFSNRLFEIKSREVISSGILIFLLGLVIISFFSWIAGKAILEPVKHLAVAARNIAEGNTEANIELNTNDEIGLLVDSFNHMTERINIHLADLSNKNSSLDSKVYELSTLKQISLSLNSLTNVDQVFEAIVDHAINVLGGVKRCSLLLVDDKKNEFIFKVVKGLEPESIPENRRKEIAGGIAAKVKSTGEPVLLNDLAEEDDTKLLEEAKIVRSSLCVPIIDDGKVFAILSAGNRITGIPFSEEDLRVLNGVAKVAGSAIKKAKNYQELNRKILELNTLHEVSKTLNIELDINKLLEMILDLTQKVLGGVKTCSIILHDEETNCLQVMVYHGDKDVSTLQPIMVGEGIAGRVFEKGEPIIINDFISSDSTDKTPEDARSSICVPLKVRDKPIGVLSVSDKSGGEIFDKSDLDMLVTLASQIAVAIYNAQLYEDLEASYLSAVRALANSLDEKDAYTRGHSERVARYSMEIGRVMRLETEDIKTLHIGALLHDIGKIGISEAIINKNSRLTDNEFETIKTHPSRGASIIEPAKFLKEKVPLIKYHHERFDGKGYPEGLKGHDIPMLARIICVADSYDAMTSKRAYRDVMPREEARNELIRCSGTQFDPKVVSAFLEVLENEKTLEAIEKLGK